MLSKIDCTRRIQFCAGHRVVGHSQCQAVHGHNYSALVYARAKQLDVMGMVIDFGVLKERVGGWIDKNWDHTFIISRLDDTGLSSMIQKFCPKPIYELPGNPTAENMANHLLLDICPNLFLDTNVQVYKIVIWETENCFATAELLSYEEICDK